MEIAHRNYLSEVAKDLAIRPEDRLLDIGCGTGATAIKLVRQHGCRVYGVDIVQLHIEAAKRAVASCELEDRIELACADIRDLELPRAGFDHVISLECLYHLPDKAALFHKVYEALKPGGRFVFSELVLHRSCPWLSRQLAEFMSGSRYLERIDCYPAMLAAAGLKLLDERDVSAQTLISAHRWSALQGHRLAIDYIRVTNGKYVAFAVPLFFRLAVRGVRQGHWGLHFIHATRPH
jgi:cyclopropane fatty-acyl-phospholipid synthase-like methyltransferase